MEYMEYVEKKIRTGDKKGRLLRDPYTSNLSPILARIERLMEDKGSFSLIKHGSTTTVGLVKGEHFGIPFDIMVKRFNYKGMLHSIAKKITGTRAKHLYRINLKLFEKGLNVPRPIGFMEAMDMKKAFYISEYEETAGNLATLYVNGLFRERNDIAPYLAKTLARWHLSGAVHGDLKWSNILVAKDGAHLRFLFVDLDQTNLFRRPNIKGINKDIQRFLRYGEKLSARKWLKEEFLPSYMSFMTSNIRERLEKSLRRF